MNRDTILVSSFVNLSFAESEYLVYCSKNQFEISGKTYYKGNDITNTTSPVKITFCYTFIRIVNIWCKDVLKVLFFWNFQALGSLESKNSTAYYYFLVNYRSICNTCQIQPSIIFKSTGTYFLVVITYKRWIWWADGHYISIWEFKSQNCNYEMIL